MNIFSLSAFVLAGAIVSVLLKNNARKEYSTAVQIVCAIVVFGAVAIQISDIIKTVVDLGEGIGVDIGYIKTIIKVLGVCVLTQFVCEVCNDSGENALASQIEFAGKVVVVTLMLPLLKSITEIVMGIIT